jgi:pimeloyl-ACP methyl ester carboxylesterase
MKADFNPIKKIWLFICTFCVLLIPHFLIAQKSGENEPAFNKIFTHKTIIVNGFKMHYVTGGKGSPVILLHGWPETWYEWRKIMPGLAKHYTVIAPDLRGLGDSEKPGSGYDKKTLADDIHKLVLQLGYKNIYLVGHDWGAPVAYDYATAHPDEVTKLVLLEIPPPDSTLMQVPAISKNGSDLWWFSFHMVKNLPEELVKGKEETYLRYFFNYFSFNKSAFTQKDIKEYVRCYSAPGAMKAGFEYYRSVFKDIDDDKICAETKLKMPVLALGGDHSFGMVLFNKMKKLAENVQGGVIENCGHFIAEEQPAKLSEQLLLFFK